MCWGSVRSQDDYDDYARASGDQYARRSGERMTPRQSDEYARRSHSPATQRVPPAPAGGSTLRPNGRGSQSRERRGSFEPRRQNNEGGGALPAASRLPVNFAWPDGYAGARSVLFHAGEISFLQPILILSCFIEGIMATFSMRQLEIQPEALLYIYLVVHGGVFEVLQAGCALYVQATAT